MQAKDQLGTRKASLLIIVSVVRSLFCSQDHAITEDDVHLVENEGPECTETEFSRVIVDIRDVPGTELSEVQGDIDFFEAREFLLGDMKSVATLACWKGDCESLCLRV